MFVQDTFSIRAIWLYDNRVISVGGPSPFGTLALGLPQARLPPQIMIPFAKRWSRTYNTKQTNQINKKDETNKQLKQQANKTPQARARLPPQIMILLPRGGAVVLQGPDNKKQTK